MVRANPVSHPEGIVVARKPRRINRRPQRAPTTMIPRSAKRNAFNAFMPVQERAVGLLVQPLANHKSSTAFYSRASVLARVQGKAKSQFGMRLPDQSENDT